ncbi:hypothetical protein TGRH88_036240 [Toxoplasma gondii]|uniref:Uncharacterized protein n=1 Tax=Toxoplasma gondii TaxID=5811 RepID=A0A7J6K603_TOXGO|nr:hypothetical protein TGRH88_036240 [Toxoplasma gondii]
MQPRNQAHEAANEHAETLACEAVLRQHVQRALERGEHNQLVMEEQRSVWEERGARAQQRRQLRHASHALRDYEAMFLEQVTVGDACLSEQFERLQLLVYEAFKCLSHFLRLRRCLRLRPVHNLRGISHGAADSPAVAPRLDPRTPALLHGPRRALPRDSAAPLCALSGRSAGLARRVPIDLRRGFALALGTGQLPGLCLHVRRGGPRARDLVPRGRDLVPRVRRRRTPRVDGGAPELTSSRV